MISPRNERNDKASTVRLHVEERTNNADTEKRFYVHLRMFRNEVIHTLAMGG